MTIIAGTRMSQTRQIKQKEIDYYQVSNKGQIELRLRRNSGLHAKEKLLFQEDFFFLEEK